MNQQNFKSQAWAWGPSDQATGPQAGCSGSAWLHQAQADPWRWPFNLDQALVSPLVPWSFRMLLAAERLVPIGSMRALQPANPNRSNRSKN